jgi:hypothetical protein
MQITITTTIFGLPTGRRTTQTHLVLPLASLTVGELIACKVRQEVTEYRVQQRSGLSGEYLSPEELLGAEPPTVLVPGAVHTEIARAQQAFAARDYMIVINNRRLFDLEEVITLCPDTQIEFIKILPLIGG